VQDQARCRIQQLPI